MTSNTVKCTYLKFSTRHNTLEKIYCTLGDFAVVLCHLEKVLVIALATDVISETLSDRGLLLLEILIFGQISINKTKYNGNLCN